MIVAIPEEFGEIEAIADTNMVSYVMSSSVRDREIAARYRDDLEARITAITFQSQVEILVGLETQRWDPARLERVLAGYRVIPWLPEMHEFYVAIQVEAARRGRDDGARRRKAADVWNAAAAMLLGVPLVTHNARDFRAAETLGLEVVSHADR